MAPLCQYSSTNYIRAAADFLAQQATSGPHDWGRTALFGVFGALYLGGFQYAYQVLGGGEA